MEVRKGYKQTEVGVIPEDWEVRHLGKEIDELIAGISVNSVNEDQFLYAHEESILKTSAVVNGIFLPHECKKIAPRDIDRAKLNPQKNTIIISRMNTPELVGESGYVDKNYPNLFLPDRLWMTHFRKNSKICVKWLAYLLNTRTYKTKIKGSATGTSGSMKNISKDSLFSIYIPYPDPSEQTAIASALSDADALIQFLEKLIAKKHNIKQGAMQELLKPKEGWVVKRLGEIADVSRGRVISHKEINASIEGKYPVYSSQTTNNGIMGYIDTFDFEGEYVTWTTDGVNAGKVFFRSGRFNCTNVCGTIKLKSDNPSFIALMLDTVTAKYVSRNLANPKLMNDPVKKIGIALPKLEEQTRIATILSDMDAEISALETKLTKYKQIKQGMMQELLTGKIRLV